MSYDGLAPFYGLLERLVFRGQMQRCRCALLPEIAAELPEGASVLSLGEGRGSFVRALAQLRPDLTLTVLDGSERMLSVARRRLEKSAPETATRARWLHAELLSADLAEDPSADPCADPAAVGEGFALIACCFFLDSFEGAELESVLHRILAWLAPEGRVLICDFRQAPRGLARVRSRAWLRLLYASFAWSTGLRARRLEDPEPLLLRGRCVLMKDWRGLGGLLQARSYLRQRP
jgi:SAM-dependent methyltransferase